MAIQRGKEIRHKQKGRLEGGRGNSRKEGGKNRSKSHAIVMKAHNRISGARVCGGWGGGGREGLF